jgi:hypothetical protein
MTENRSFDHLPGFVGAYSMEEALLNVATGCFGRMTRPRHLRFIRLTPEGREFLKDVRTQVGVHSELDWTRADEIDLSKL